MVSSTTLVSLTSPSKAIGRNMGVFWAAGSLGWAMPLTFSGYLLNRFGIESIFNIALFASLLIVPFSIALNKCVEDVKKPAGIGSLSSGKRTLFSFLGNRVYLLFLISAIIFGASDVAKNIYVPQYYAYGIGLGETWATLLLGIASWFEIPMLIVFGYAVDRYGSRRVYVFSLTSMAVFMALNIFVVRDAATAFIAMAFYSIVWAETLECSFLYRFMSFYASESYEVC